MDKLTLLDSSLLTSSLTDSLPPFSFTFGGGQLNKYFFQIKADGSVELGPGISLDQATLAFWSFVLQHSPINDFIRKAERLDEAVIRALGPDEPSGSTFRQFHDALEKIKKVQDATRSAGINSGTNLSTP